MLVDDLGQAEIGDVRFAVGVDEDVLGFDVAVDDAVLVGIMEGVGDRGTKTRGVAGGEIVVFAPVFEVGAFDEAADDVEDTLLLAFGVDGDDVGVLQLGRRFGLAEENGRRRCRVGPSWGV